MNPHRPFPRRRRRLTPRRLWVALSCILPMLTGPQQAYAFDSPSLSELAESRSEVVEIEALKRKVSDLEFQLRSTDSMTRARIAETGLDLAQCLCNGRVECLQIQVELP
jgi:hypothetical protein